MKWAIRLKIVQNRRTRYVSIAGREDICARTVPSLAEMNKEIDWGSKPRGNNKVEDQLVFLP
jgi:hypothetical protein